ncbi:MAG: cupin, partial [Gammaproteobacteria bacterium RBG_16_57_12]
MADIKIIHQPDSAQLQQDGIHDWPIWTKEISKFPWTYDSNETCYFLEGDVIVTPEGGAAVRIGQGDLVTFPS